MAGELTMCTQWGQYQVSWPCYEDAIRWVDRATVWGCYQVNWSRYDAANRWIDRAMRPLSDKLTTLWWYDEGGSVWLLCTVEYCILFIAWEYWTKVRRRELSSPPLTGRNTRRRKEVGRRRRRRRSSAIIWKQASECAKPEPAIWQIIANSGLCHPSRLHFFDGVNLWGVRWVLRIEIGVEGFWRTFCHCSSSFWLHFLGKFQILSLQIP